jgi:hypothetical protein
MADQIVLAWTVDVTGTPFGPAEAATALGAVPLYTEVEADPVLGQLFGLTVDSDVTGTAGSTATRTLTLNMNAVNSPEAPPIFQCRPRSQIVDIDPPYPLTRNVSLVGSFFVSEGSTFVPTTATQVPSLSVGDSIQFLSQPGIFYTVAAITPTDITLTGAYTGTTANTEAFKEEPAPVVLAGIFSTSPLDTDGVGVTAPPIPAGPGARTIDLTYMDSTGAGPFTVSVSLTGKRPAPVTLDPGSVDIAEVVSMVITSTGGFGNSVGQLTLVELSEPLAPFPESPTLADFRRLTDETQLTIIRHLVYMPPSYFALAQQSTSQPELEGDFFVTTGSRRVATSADQTAALAPGNVIQFASQLTTNSPLGTVDVFYTVDAVGPRAITLTTPYTGLDDNFTGSENLGVNSERGTKGNVGSQVQNKATGARLVEPSPAAPPSDGQLSVLVGQFVAPAVAMPPPSPPLSPATILPPTFLSDLFTQTLQLALAGVPITPEPIMIVP